MSQGDTNGLLITKLELSAHNPNDEALRCSPFELLDAAAAIRREENRSLAIATLIREALAAMRAGYGLAPESFDKVFAKAKEMGIEV